MSSPYLPYPSLRKEKMKHSDFTKNSKMVNIRLENWQKLKQRADRNGRSLTDELDRLLKRTLRNEKLEAASEK